MAYIPNWGVMPSEWEQATSVQTCVVMLDPTHDIAKCKAPASPSRTVLDYPICDTCYDLVSRPVSVEAVRVKILGLGASA